MKPAGDSSEPENTRTTSNRWTWFCAGLGVLLVVIAARLWVIHTYSTPLPFFDQWLIEPPFYFLAHKGELTWAYLFSAANEHRIFWTRIISISAFLANDQHWDPQVQMAINTLFAGLTAAVAAILLGQGLPDRQRLFLVFCTTAMFALPLSWYNTIWGIQSLMFLLVLFSLAGLLLMNQASPASARFWVGFLLLVAALFTMGSGFLAAMVVCGIAIWRMIEARRLLRAEAIRGGLCLLLAVAGLALLDRKQSLSNLGADSVADFCVAFLRHCAFPFSIETTLSPFGWVGLVAGLPVLGLGILYFFGKLPTTTRRSLEPVLLVAAWVLLQFAVMAIARGQDGRGPTWRHFDVHLLWPLTNLVALIWLGKFSGTASTPLAQRFRSATVIWSAVILTGIVLLTTLALREAGFRQSYNAQQERAVRNFLNTGDPEVLQGSPGREIPALPEEIIPVLRSEFGREILPAGVRDPLRLQVNSQDSSGFQVSPGTLRTWTSPVENEQPVVLQSQPVSSSATFLQVIVSVPAPLHRDNSFQLALQEIGSDEVEPFYATGTASGGQQIYRAKVPQGGFRLIAIDDSADSAFTFSEPIETGRMTALVTDWRTRWPAILFAGVLLLISTLAGIHPFPWGKTAHFAK